MVDGTSSFATRARHFRVAGRVVSTDLAAPELEPYETRASGLLDSATPPSACQPQGPVARVFSGLGWVAGGDRELDSSFDGQFHHLWVEGVGKLWISASGRACGCSQIDDIALSKQAILGPGLTLCLAAQHTFCLHASAVQFGRLGAVAFAGDSGSGKSTLAAVLEVLSSDNCRAADDILAIGRNPDMPSLRRDFPQPQLPEIHQPRLHKPAETVLSALCLLEPSQQMRSVELRRIAPSEALTAIIRHTVASRLFDPTLSEEHFSFSASLASSLPTFVLSYPWIPESAQWVSKKLTEWLVSRRVSVPGTAIFQE